MSESESVSKSENERHAAYYDGHDETRMIDVRFIRCIQEGGAIKSILIVNASVLIASARAEKRHFQRAQ